MLEDIRVCDASQKAKAGTSCSLENNQNMLFNNLIIICRSHLLLVNGDIHKIKPWITPLIPRRPQRLVTTHNSRSEIKTPYLRKFWKILILPRFSSVLIIAFVPRILRLPLSFNKCSWFRHATNLILETLSVYKFTAEGKKLMNLISFPSSRRRRRNKEDDSLSTK